MRTAGGPKFEALVFNVLEQAAKDGRRCPTNPDIASEINAGLIFNRRAGSSIAAIIQSLIRKGLVTVRLYGVNYRDVTILTGPHTGKFTKTPSHGGSPHVIIDRAERERRDKAPNWQRLGGRSLPR